MCGIIISEYCEEKSIVITLTMFNKPRGLDKTSKSELQQTIYTSQPITRVGNDCGKLQ